MSMYDEKISENVSLSKVLDILIESEEPSDIIVNFLKMYDNDFKEIASRSICNVLCMAMPYASCFKA